MWKNAAFCNDDRRMCYSDVSVLNHVYTLGKNNKPKGQAQYGVSILSALEMKSLSTILWRGSIK